MNQQERQQRHEAYLKNAEALVARRKEHGGTVKDFCKEIGIKPSLYFYRQGVLRKSHLVPPVGASDTPDITLSEVLSTTTPKFVVTSNGEPLMIHSGYVFAMNGTAVPVNRVNGITGKVRFNQTQTQPISYLCENSHTFNTAQKAVATLKAGGKDAIVRAVKYDELVLTIADLEEYFGAKVRVV